MKCPKCNYLGFETGERCKNCGYDFSLLAAFFPAESQEPDLRLRLAAEPVPASESWLDRVDRMAPSYDTASAEPAIRFDAPLVLREPEAAVPAPPRLVAVPPHEVGQVSGVTREAGRGPGALPLFTPEPKGSEPLVRMPAVPRAPLAVRRTPEVAKLRAGVRQAKPHRPEPIFEFDDGGDEHARTSQPEALGTETPRTIDGKVGGVARRLAAATLDHLILCAIDVSVVYFTLRIVAMSWSGLPSLPIAPLIVFLGLVKLSYFWAFTTVGGQTIGKMAARICVVSENGESLDAGRALHRTISGAVSLLTLGFGLIPILFDSDRRALHDRIARTRVIEFRSA